jgi:hypothetical protein
LTISNPLGVGQTPVENSWGTYRIKKCSPEKVVIKTHLQIDTLPTQKLEFIYRELTYPRPEQQKWVFWQMQKLRFLILEIKSHMLKNSTVFNIL